MSLLSHLNAVWGAVLPFLFVLSIVIFFHELGHFIVGRLCGVKVDAFSLGFGPELFAYTDRSGTRWRLGLLPLGGYVKFHGDANGASMSDEAGVAAMPASERDGDFLRAKGLEAGGDRRRRSDRQLPSRDRDLHGNLRRPRTRHSRSANRKGRRRQRRGRRGLQAGRHGDLNRRHQDRQLRGHAANRSDVERPAADLHRHASRQRITLVATPRRREVKTSLGRTSHGVLGVEANASAANWHIQHYGIVDSTRLACGETWFIIKQTGTYVGGLFTGRELTDQLSGPIRIAEVSGEMAKIGFAALLNLAAVLSISIGILNLVPIPLLDGGHLFYYAIEAVRGRALNDNIQQFGFKIGLTLVAGLMILATYNDILRLTR